MSNVETIHVQIFGPENGPVKRHKFTAGAGRVFTEDGITAVLEHVGNHLEQKFPGQDFRMIELGESEFNFVWAGGHELGKAEEKI